MKKRDINTLVIGLLMLFLMFSVGCGKEESKEILTVANCTVSKQGVDAVISCPDGSNITLPPEIINDTITTIVDVPIVIEVNKGRCGKK